MFKFFDQENNTYNYEALIIELKEAINTYDVCAEIAIETNRSVAAAMQNFEIAAGKEITLGNGKLLQWSDVIGTGAIRHPELRNTWIWADVRNVEAKERLMMAKNKVNALTEIVSMLAR